MYLLHWARLSAADALSATTELNGIAATAATRKNRRTSISFRASYGPSLTRSGRRNRATPICSRIEGRPVWPPLDDAIPRWGWSPYAAARSTANEGSAVPFGDTMPVVNGEPLLGWTRRYWMTSLTWRFLRAMRRPCFR